MKLYLFLSITSILVHRDFGKNIDKVNPESNVNLTEDKAMSMTENLLKSTINTEILTTTEKSKWDWNNFTPVPITDSYFDFMNESEEKEEIIPEPNCPEHMQPYVWMSEEQIWKCLCIQPFYRVPMNNTCVKLFRQGPCEPGNFVIQPGSGRNKTTGPRCAPNPCVEDKLVPLNGTCHDMTVNSICDEGRPLFNETSSEIRCKLSRPRTVIDVPHRPKCPPGSRTARNGKCRRKL